jgi:glycosyltransferase involved in cell wall biosynthesis
MKISIVTPCFNERDNLDELHARVHSAMAGLPYDYEHLLIDNHSTDGTVEKLRQLAASDSHVKVILNARNFGHIRSPFHGILQATGDAVVVIASDLQDPPEMIPEFIRRWEAGAKAVMAVKPASAESKAMFSVRRLYYRFVSRISDVPLVHDATGAGLYDRQVVEVLRDLHDPYPYFRGLIAEIGLPIDTVEFTQPKRTRGITKNNFYTLYDMAMLGITNHSKVPLRLMTMMGFALSLLGGLTGFCYLVAKLVFWNSFQLGTAPVLIGVFLFGSLQMFMIGIIGEYLGAVLTHVRQLPHVVELERLNFD